MHIEIGENEISVIDTTIKKINVRRMQIDGRTLLNDDDSEIIDAESIDSRNDFSSSKR